MQCHASVDALSLRLHVAVWYFKAHIKYNQCMNTQTNKRINTCYVILYIYISDTITLHEAFGAVAHFLLDIGDLTKRPQAPRWSGMTVEANSNAPS